MSRKAAKWSCHRSGDCCRKVREVVMTTQEKALLPPEKAVRPPTWRPHPDSRFVVLEAAPCPFLGEDNLCQVHDVRPMNCRRWGCFRPSLAEPLNMDRVAQRLVWDRDIRRQAVQMQRKAQRFGLKHGWSEEMDGSTPLIQVEP